MNKRNLLFCIIITAFGFLGILTMFMPYLKIETKEVTQAFDVTFGDIADFDAEFEDGDSVTLINSRTGIKLFSDVVKIKTDQSYSYIYSLKKLVVGLLLTSWISTIAVIFAVWFLKRKARYIVSMILSLISFSSSLILYIGVPGIAKHALIEAIEKALFNDYGVYEHLLGSFVKDTVIDYLGRFCKELLQHSAQFGFWMLMAVMFIGFVLSLVGLILEARKGESNAKTITPVGPKLYGINGEYAGAEVLIGDGILVGRDPAVCQLVVDGEKISRKHCKIIYKEASEMFVVTDYSTNGTYILGGGEMKKNLPTELPAGTTIQLGKNGDTFRLGNQM